MHPQELADKLARAGHTTTPVGGKLVIAGGILLSPSRTMDALVVDPARLTISRWGPPAPSAQLCAPPALALPLSVTVQLLSTSASQVPTIPTVCSSIAHGGSCKEWSLRPA